MLIRICPQHRQMVPGTKRSAMQSLWLGGGGFFAPLRSAQNDMGRVHVAPLNSDWYHTFVSCLTLSPRRLTSSSPRRPVASHARLFNAKTQRGKAQSGLSAKRKAENRSLCLSYVYPFCPNYISRFNTPPVLRFALRSPWAQPRGATSYPLVSVCRGCAPTAHRLTPRRLTSALRFALRSPWAQPRGATSYPLVSVCRGCAPTAHRLTPRRPTPHASRLTPPRVLASTPPRLLTSSPYLFPYAGLS